MVIPVTTCPRITASRALVARAVVALERPLAARLLERHDLAGPDPSSGCEGDGCPEQRALVDRGRAGELQGLHGVTEGVLPHGRPGLGERRRQDLPDAPARDP